MNRTRRSLALLLLATAAPGTFAVDEPWPSKPVRVVVPFSAGSTADMVGRVLSERLSSRFKQPFVIDNRPGAGGELGAATVARAPADGYTLLLTTSSPLVINPTLSRNIAYDVEKDFAPIAQLAWVPVVLVSHPSIPARTLPELIAFLKAHPGKYGYGSSGKGSYAHITMEMFKQVTGIEINHVPYRGPSQAETDLVGGQVALMFAGISTSNPLIQAGRLRPFGVTSRVRSAFAPEIPTFVEQGTPELKGFEVTSWVSLLGPTNTPPAVIEQLHAEINAALKSPEFRDKLLAKSLAPFDTSQPKDIAARIRSELALWAKVIRNAKVEAE